MYFKTYLKEECTGCTACEHICPKGSISMVSIDNEGFKYPVIDLDTCIKCGLCEKVCPVEFPKYENSNNPEVYATYIKDEKERQSSSSGGLFFIIAKWILANNGIVYGAAFVENFKLKHVGVDNLSELEKLRGSKYVQSDLGDVFTKVKENLKNNRWVYFVGTPCQVAGLKSYLLKDFERLITSDLVCHGVPSQMLFDKHLSFLERKEKKEVVSYQFRNNKKWGGCEIVHYRNNRGNIIEKKLPTYSLSPYLYSFMYGYTSRYACYNCKFAKIPRQGDITLGDFWGVKDFFPDIDTTKGVSLITINTNKGDLLWEEVKDNCEHLKSSLKNGSKNNKSLICVSKPHKLRGEVYNKVENEGYDLVAKTLFKPERYNIIKLKAVLVDTLIWKVLRKIRDLI